MWRIPVPLIAGGANTAITFTSDEWIGDLWTYLGSPALPVDVTITADNCDVGGVYVSANFAAGSTFQMTAINGGRFIGRGGNGGQGGDDLGPSGESGGNGTGGGHALASEGFTINVDIDDGYLLGGGGGGGGAATADRGATSDAGGGGGGGIGFTGQGGTGGAGGTGSVPAATAGGTGSSSAAGAGGFAGGTGVPEPDGGAGGSWGESGSVGYHDSQFLIAGLGGVGGNAFAPISGAASVNFNGASNEATLRSQNRVLGETAGLVYMHALRTTFGSSMMSFTLGWQWQSDGELNRLNSLLGNAIQPGYFWRDTNTGTGIANFVNTNYEIRQNPDTRSGTWDADFTGTEGDWVALTSAQSISITDSAFRMSKQSIEIRRTVASGGSGNPLAMGFYAVEMEDGS